MSSKKSYTITYNSATDKRRYLIVENKNYEKVYDFEIVKFQYFTLINANYYEILDCKYKSLFSFKSFKLKFNYNEKFHGIELLQNKDCSKYELKGKYIKTTIKMTWIRVDNCKRFQLIDRSRNDAILAEILGFTLDSMDLGQINIISLIEPDFLELIIGSACMVYFKGRETKC